MIVNGRIPLNLMVLRDGVYLWPSTAARFDLFAAELVSLGYEDPRISTPFGGYRSFESQVEAKQLFGSTAATAGYSKHGLGRAFDVNNISRYPDKVIAAVALKHGLIRNAPDGKGGVESWHFFDSTGVMPAALTSVPIPAKAITSGVCKVFIFYGVSRPTQFYLGSYDGRVLKVRPVLGIESKVLTNAIPAIPRAQVTDAELVELCKQGGYVYGQPFTN